MAYIVSESDFHVAHTHTPSPDAATFTRHAHPEYELLYFLSGEADCIVHHMRHTMQPGELALIPPMAYHFISVTGNAPYERLVINFSAATIPEDILARVFAQPKILSVTDDSEIGDALARLNRYANRFSETTRTLLTRNLITELVCLLDTAQEKQSRLCAGFGEVMDDALRYIDAHLTTIVSLDELCSHLYISRAYLHRLFRNSLGISPMRYITEKRLLLAQSHLRLRERPTRVAAICGFGDYSTFYRAYQSYFGISPGQEVARRQKYDSTSP